MNAHQIYLLYNYYIQNTELDQMTLIVLWHIYAISLDTGIV